MKCDIKEGTYVNKKGKDFMDFMIKCGKFNVYTVGIGYCDYLGTRQKIVAR